MISYRGVHKTAVRSFVNVAAVDRELEENAFAGDFFSLENFETLLRGRNTFEISSFIPLVPSRRRKPI